MTKQEIYMTTRKLLFLTLFTLFTLIMKAIPAFPHAQTVVQPDGSTVTVTLHGDEWFNYGTTSDGYTVTWNARGHIVYAQVENGQLVPTGTMAHDARHRTAAEVALLQRIGKNAMPLQSEIGTQVQSRKAPAQKLSGKWDISKFRGLVILVQYSDKQFLQPDVFNDMINQEGYAGYYDNLGKQQVTCTGSVHDYFKDNSFGKFAPTFDVYGPVTLNVTQDYPQQTANARTMFETVLQQLDTVIDYTNYDTDGDGAVDMVFFIVSGGGSHAGNNGNFLWPHAFLFSGLNLDGVDFGRYACSTELYGLEKYNRIDGIGTICHEFSHVLGLPDVYDVDYATGGYSIHPGKWSIMAGGSYLDYSRTPAGYGLYERSSLGWSTPAVINSRGVRQLKPLQTSNSGYRIDAALKNEYFLIENRQNVRWDAALPGAGLIAWRVDSTSTKPWTTNRVNSSAAHNYFELIRAAEHDTTIVQDGNTYQRAIDGQWDAFPGSSGVDSLVNGMGKPNISSWTKLKTGWVLKNIKNGSDFMTFYVAKDPVSSHYEPCESMGAAQGDTVQGEFSRWKFKNAQVCLPDSGWCDGLKAVGLKKGSEIYTIDPIGENVNTVTFKYFNPTGNTSIVRCYYSTNNGLTWNTATTFSGSQFLSVKPGTINEGEFKINSTAPALFKFSLFSGSTTQYSYIDSIKINYDAPATDEPRLGDLNNDGKIDVSDVTALINMILGTQNYPQELSDLNGDTRVDVSDVTILINTILNF